MNSIFKKAEYYSVDASDLAKLIQSLYGQDPEIEASYELGHDDIIEIEANSEEFEEEEFLEWETSMECSRSEICMLMNKLAYDGHIVNGNYLIKTC